MWGVGAVCGRGDGLVSVRGPVNNKTSTREFLSGLQRLHTEKAPPTPPAVLAAASKPERTQYARQSTACVGGGVGSRVSARSLHAKFTVRYVSGWGGGTTVAVEKQGNMGGALKRRACHFKGVTLQPLHRGARIMIIRAAGGGGGVVAQGTRDTDIPSGTCHLDVLSERNSRTNRQPLNPHAHATPPQSPLPHPLLTLRAFRK